MSKKYILFIALILASSSVISNESVQTSRLLERIIYQLDSMDKQLNTTNKRIDNIFVRIENKNSVSNKKIDSLIKQVSTLEAQVKHKPNELPQAYLREIKDIKEVLSKVEHKNEANEDELKVTNTRLTKIESWGALAAILFMILQFVYTIWKDNKQTNSPPFNHAKRKNEEFIIAELSAIHEKFDQVDISTVVPHKESIKRINQLGEDNDG